jgi:glycosyltransferase involved in cell wall biosynthesis
VKILYHCAFSEGGLAEYARHQARALSELQEVQVLWQAPRELLGPTGVESLAPLILIQRSLERPRWCRAKDFLNDSLEPWRALIEAIRYTKPDSVLVSTWSEYFSPLWAPKLRCLRKRGVRFGAVIHDPVRDFIRGPIWWHRYSVRQAYSFLDVAFTHDDTAIDTCGSRATFKTVVVPHGPYPVEVGSADKAALRREFGIPEDADVMLSFGHIRDGKNLDQIIAALPALPKAHLLVAGREQSGGQKPVGFYRDLAQRLGVGNRCHWRTDYIPNDEVWKYFRASDVLMLTYSKDFRSASGALNVNAQFGLPVIASAGGGPLLQAVSRYNLGTIVPNVSPPSIADALPGTLGIRGEWDRFTRENSWKVNAERVVEALRGNAETLTC